MTPVELVSQVKKALQEALPPEAIGRLNIRLDSVILTVSTEVSKDGGISFTIPVVNTTIGGGLGTDRTSTLEMTLEPPIESNIFKSVDPSRDIREQLVAGLQQTLNLIEQLDGMTDEPKLGLKQSSFELNFVVTAQGKIELVAFLDGKKAETHTVKLVLKRP